MKRSLYQPLKFLNNKKRTFAKHALQLSAPLLKKRQRKRKREQLSLLIGKWKYSEIRKHINKKELWKFLVIFPNFSLFHYFQNSSSPLSFLSLHQQISDWISTHSNSTHFQNYASQIGHQVISSSLISDPPVLVPISGASPSFSQSHLLLKFCGV